MVDLATFRTFPRASPDRQSAELTAEPDAPVANSALTGEATPLQTDPDLRALRRAARTDMRQSEAWAEPESVQPPSDPLPLAPPPEPLELQKATPAEAAPEPETAELPPVEEGPALRGHYTSHSHTLDYRLLGLANPLVCTVTGTIGDTTPIGLTVGRSGLYRPENVRPAAWTGFAYDVSPDGRTGLVLGTRILTARGEIPVEDLLPGDTALALRGPALLPIVGVGRSIAVPPTVEIAADAFGPGRPGKTLRVGADHPIFIEATPVPACTLVNGGTIRSLDTEMAELFHIDVGFAEVLLAENVPLSSGRRA